PCLKDSPENRLRCRTRPRREAERQRDFRLALSSEPRRLSSSKTPLKSPLVQGGTTPRGMRGCENLIPVEVGSERRSRNAQAPGQDRNLWRHPSLSTALTRKGGTEATVLVTPRETAQGACLHAAISANFELVDKAVPKRALNRVHALRCYV